MMKLQLLSYFDRLIHHLHLINVTGESYRLKQKREAELLDISAK